MTAETYNLISIIVGIVILGITTWYAYLTRKIMEASNKTYELSRKNSITEIHNRFQTSMRELQLTFPHTINNSDIGLDESQKRSVQLYWYLVLDEYLTCKILSNDPEMNFLWDKYYFNGVKSALRLKNFYDAIAVLLDGGSTFLGIGEEFEAEIVRANGGVKPTLENYKPKTN